MYPWHVPVWERLAPNRNKLAHALLFYGQRGTGKLSFVRYLAQTLVCENQKSAQGACGQCSACAWFINDAHPDIRVLRPETYQFQEPAPEGKKPTDNPAKNGSNRILISQVRSLTDFVNVASHRGGHKIILIQPAESMNPQAANALLKMLEEPPVKTLFFLVTDQMRLLPPTILSRCEKIALPTPEKQSAVKWLAQQGIEKPELSLAQTGNAPLSALQLTQDDYWARREKFLSELCADEFNPVTTAESLQRDDLSRLIEWLQKWLYDLLSLKYVDVVRYHLDYEPALRKLSSKLNPKELSRYYRDLTYRQRIVNHPLNPRLVLEELFLGYIALNSSKS